MIRELPRRIDKLLVLDTVIDASKYLIRRHKSLSHVERCVLWYGFVLSSEVALATTCLMPRQTCHQRSYQLSGADVRDARLATRPHGLMLLAQVHSHPRQAYFSDWDKANPLNQDEGALNLVVPNFGTTDWDAWEGFCMVESDGRGNWIEWSEEEWANRLTIVPTVMDRLGHG